MVKHIRDAWPVILILGTIMGAAWTAAWNVRGFLTTRIETSETHLRAELARSEEGLRVEIVQSEARLRTEIAQSEARLRTEMTRSEARLAARMAQSEARLTGQMAELTVQIGEIRQLLVEHLRDHADIE